MIRKNLINCKLFREKRSGKNIILKSMDYLHLQDEACPYCKCKGRLRLHGYYERTLIDFINGKPVTSVLCVCRLICVSCYHPTTHSVLPDPVIPYCRHSLRFILRVLAEHCLRFQPVEKICERFDISIRTFYRWRRLFEEHRKEWQGCLTAVQKDLKDSILSLIHTNPFSALAASFFQRTGMSLLQSHSNPVYPVRKDPIPGSSVTT